MSGFAGFAVMDPEAKNDWLAVLGASYFRTSGYSGQFGMSARGPRDRLGRARAGGVPALHPLLARAGAGRAGIVIYALLGEPAGHRRLPDGDRRTSDGVFQDIDAALFLRGDIARLGIAPLTSMFWYGKNNHFVGPDWRPEIHDSDGLEMQLGNGRADLAAAEQPAAGDGERVPRRRASGASGSPSASGASRSTRTTGCSTRSAPRVWVEPQGDWGEGSVMLVELPTNDEIHDNIVAFWNPAAAAAPGSSYDLHYKLSWVKRIRRR